MKYIYQYSLNLYMSANERLINQMVEILVYDFNNKYHNLKNNGLNKDQINRCMDDYQKSRIQSFKDDFNRIQNLKKNDFNFI